MDQKLYCISTCNYISLYLLASQMVDLDEFVEMTKNYAQGIAPATPKNGSQVSAATESPALHNSRTGVKEKKGLHFT